jgi:hypothetical protein
VDLAKNDPYPGVRVEAIERLSRAWGIPKKEVFAVLTDALDDPHFYVRIYAASTIIYYCTYDSIIPDPRALKMVKDAALGLGRTDWNVKGFYTKDQLKSNPEAVEKAKDKIQRKAIDCLDIYIQGITGDNRSIMEYLDSIVQHGASVKIRSAAENSKKLYLIR